MTGTRSLQGNTGPGQGASGGRAEEFELHAVVSGDPLQCLCFVLEAQNCCGFKSLKQGNPGRGIKQGLREQSARDGGR